MADELESISLGSLFWIQFKKDRMSFRMTGILEDIHFTVSWHPNSPKINLHLTRNISDERNKPKIVIAEIEKKVAAELMTFLPAVVFHHLFIPVSYKSCSRKSRKNIRLCFYDDLEKHSARAIVEKNIIQQFKQVSATRRKKLRIDASAADTFLPALQPPEMKSIFWDNLRNLTRHSFNSPVLRAGIVFMGKKTSQFISVKGKCYELREKITVSELLACCMTTELAKSLTQEIQKAIIQLQKAKTFADTIPFNRPHQLFIENAG